MRERLEGQVAILDMLAEIRTYEWDRPESHTFEYSDYHLVSLLSRKRGVRLGWQLAKGESRPFEGISIIPPRSPLTLQATAGAITIASCIFSVGNFERAIEVGQWTDELSNAFLSVRNPFLEAVLHRLANEIRIPSARSQVLFEVLIASIKVELACMVQLQDNVRVGPGALSKWQLKQFREAVEAAYEARRQFELAELAASCSISVRHLQRGFKAATGITPYAYFKRVRLEKAKALLALESESLSLKEVALEAGFITASQFSAEFRQLMGCTPSQYRANLRRAVGA